MAQPQPVKQPRPVELLNTPQLFQAYLNSCPPGLTSINLWGDTTSLTSLEGVVFPPALTSLGLNNSQIISLRGVVFPPALSWLALTNCKITSLEGVVFPTRLERLVLNGNQITSLRGVVFPPTLSYLGLSHNQITSFEGFVFPPRLTNLLLGNNQITSIEGVVFPPTLTQLYLNHNQIDSIEVGVNFPPGLKSLNLSSNKIDFLEAVEFPPGLEELNLSNNPLESLDGIINPNEYILDYLKHNYPSLYFDEFHYQRKDEKSALKATRQSHKEELKVATELRRDLKGQSIQNQLIALTSFLREGMEARSNENAELLQGTSCIKVMIYGKVYLVPFDTTMSVQSVLDYLNDKYYISALVPNCSVMHLNYNGSTLEPEQTLADYNVQVDSQVNVKCKIEINYGGKRVKQTIKKSKKRVKKYTNKSIRNYNKVRKI